ncbi:MAG: EamA family transporter [Rhodospirillaceae bacterium]
MFSLRSPLLVPLAGLIVAMLSLQIGASIAKTLFPSIGSEGATTLRLVLSAALLTAVLRPWRARITKSNWRAVAVYGASLAGMNLAFYTALQTIPLGIAVALEFSGPMAVAMIWSRRPIDFLWVALAVAGLLLLLPISATSRALDPAGVMYALVAGVCWAIYIVAGQKAGSDHGRMTAVLGLIIAAALIAPVGISSAGAALFSWSVLPAGIAVAILSGALPYTLEMYALRRLPTHTFGTLMSLEPALGAVTGFILMRETLAPLHIGAIMIIVLASAGATFTIKHKAELHLPD